MAWSEEDLLTGSSAFVTLNQKKLSPKRLTADGSKDPAVLEPDTPSKRRGRAEEERFAGRVITLARSHGWRAQHVLAGRSPAKVTERGEPDIRFWHPYRGFFAAELKMSLASAATGFQLRTLCEWAMAGIEVHVWTPDDWEAIEWRLGPEGRRPDFADRSDGIAERIANRFDALVEQGR